MFYTEDNVFEDDNQIKSTTFGKLEDSFIKESDVGVREKDPIKDDHEVDTSKAEKIDEEEEKRSITEEDGATITVDTVEEADGAVQTDNAEKN